MAPDPAASIKDRSRGDALFGRLLGGMSIFTLLMTVPQVLTIWVGGEAADHNIYLPCVGWAGLDAAVIVGALVHG